MEIQSLKLELVNKIIHTEDQSVLIKINKMLSDKISEDWWDVLPKEVQESIMEGIKDVDEGREHLNFSEWGKYITKAGQVKDEIWEEVKEEHMPPWMYRIVHSSAKLSLEEKDIIRAWATN